ncbi:ribulose bisphosphate carboxylase small subunit [Hymenobacter sp. 1B]|uniref:Ribulose bisphosphate carboxylase small subunit n=1 Tax=Hymenobacter artigasi TaxID=2719616 RepID=A0ABX1HMT5_9BACT|nr:ribulose bisphosphate carboxylase small subunit [Hymenobacter artigasi]
MTTEQLESLLAQGEGISIEFKQARQPVRPPWPEPGNGCSPWRWPRG